MPWLFVLLAAYFWWRERRLHAGLDEQLRQSQERLVETQKLARIGTWEFDIQTDVIRWSEETFHIFGLSAGNQEPDFADILLSIHPEDASAFDRAVQQAITARQSYRLDLRIRTPGGDTKHIHAQGSPALDPSGEVRRIIGTVLDITERKQNEQRLAQEAIYDVLTGLVNRRYLTKQLAREIGIAERAHTDLSVCICDLDHFKTINDTYGHTSGDEVLAGFGKLLAQEVRMGDVAGRLGGDEFCLLFPRASAQQARVGVERIRKGLQSHVFTAPDGRQFKATGTFGIAQWQPGVGQNALMETADAALYRAKKQGRNQSAIAA